MGWSRIYAGQEEKREDYFCPGMPEFSSLDRHFARFLTAQSGDERKEVLLAAALTSLSTREGNVCLDLKTVAGRPLIYQGEAERLPSWQEWYKMLRENSGLGRPGERRPLILDDQGRLYLYRYWEYENVLASSILSRVKSETSGRAWSGADPVLIREKLDLFFPREAKERPNRQKLAALVALCKGLTVISGSPGTGKTTTVTKIIAFLQELSGERKLDVALAAPTGKAAVRLQEAVRKARIMLPCSPLARQTLPEEATTIHRLLESIPDSPYFRRHRKNPLDLDVAVVDEASMVDLPLLSKLIQALPAKAGLILLGDRDQLTSVEAGAVLGDICGSGSLDVFSSEFIREAETLTGERWEGIVRPGGLELDDCLVELKTNYRFGEDSGIGKLSEAVNGGDRGRAVSLLQAGSFQDLRWSGQAGGDFLSFLKENVRGPFRKYLKAVFRHDPEEAFACFEAFRILCPLRQGARGVETVNAVLERLLAAEGLVVPKKRWYPGRPVMITRNDYRLRLFNGDLGIIMEDSEASGELRAFFRDPSGSIRKFIPSALPEHETVYAMTVHKSQGSEFDRVLLVLPDRPTPLLTRELIYTGLTRAKEFVDLWGPKEILEEALARRINRTSGLRDALWS